jgi:hypothetical protein
MTRFTEQNTEGFTSEELAEMNKALDMLADEGRDDDMNHISDFINNAYVPGMTAVEYVAAYKARQPHSRAMKPGGDEYDR